MPPSQVISVSSASGFTSSGFASAAAAGTSAAMFLISLVLMNASAASEAFFPCSTDSLKLACVPAERLSTSSFAGAESALIAASSSLETNAGGTATSGAGARQSATSAAAEKGRLFIEVAAGGAEIRVVAGPFRKPSPSCKEYTRPLPRATSLSVVISTGSFAKSRDFS